MIRIFRIEVLIGVVVLGYIVGFPFMWIALQDARAISRRIWAAVGQRRSRWEHQLLLGYALAGWPAIPIFMSWRRSRLRVDLRAEQAAERDRTRY